MTKETGRLLRIQRPDAGNPGQFLNVCGFRSRNFNLVNSMVEETDIDCANPENAPTRDRTYGVQDRTFSGSGRFDSDADGIVLADAAENAGTLTGYKVISPGYGEWVGDWGVSDFTFTGEEEGSMTFSCTIVQFGKPTFTAAV